MYRMYPNDTVRYQSDTMWATTSNIPMLLEEGCVFTLTQPADLQIMVTVRLDRNEDGNGRLVYALFQDDDEWELGENFVRFDDNLSVIQAVFSVSGVMEGVVRFGLKAAIDFGEVFRIIGFDVDIGIFESSVVPIIPIPEPTPDDRFLWIAKQVWPYAYKD